MVLMCFFIYNFSFFVPNIIKKEIGYKKKAIKTHKHTQKHTFLSPVHTNCRFC